MADPYADLANASPEMQERIADAMAARCLDPAQVALRAAYLGNLELPGEAHAVEFGSGTGHVTCDLIDLCGAATALGIEPSEIMVQTANRTHAERKEVTFVTGNAQETGLDDESCDIVLMHTLLCHVPGPQSVIDEAARILKPGGLLAVCDGDYDTSTTAIGEFDPLEPLVKFMINENVTNLWIMRQIAPMLRQAGFQVGKRTGHGYVAEGDATYFLTVIDRAADLMADRGLMGVATAEALKSEARDRVARQAFFGFMSYVSLIATKEGGEA